MKSLPIDLYTALTEAKINTDQTRAVVDALQEHINMEVTRANEAVLAKIDGLGTRLDAMQKSLIAKIEAIVSGRIAPLETAEQVRMSRFRWVVGTILTMIGLTAAIATTLRGFHII